MRESSFEEKDVKILVVDDEPAIRKFVARALKEFAEIIEAYDQQSAKMLFVKDHFEAALVDVNLGSENGIELAVWLRDMDPQLVVIVMSGDPANKDKVRDAALGQMLSKPFTVDELKQRV
jgi:DNA-binding response OmpR family regulator